MTTAKLGSIILILFLTVATSAQWIKQTVNTNASFRGLSVVNEKVVWASGTGGTVIRTTDSGKTWKVVVVPGAEKLDFRDIEAFDADTAYILSIGNGESSRIYKTLDGGATWTEQFRNKDEKAFFDAIACWDKNDCIAMSDPVAGRFVLISTSDAGATWKPIGGNGLPVAKEGEAAFAASGTCLYIGPNGVAYLVTGGNDARVFRSTDRGSTWIVADTPIVRGTSGSGIFSIAVLDARNGVIVGGNYERPNEAANDLAFTSDGGRTWKASSGLSGYRSGVAYINKKKIIAVGTNGTDLTTDGGRKWYRIGSSALNSVAASGQSVWAVGPAGVVAKLSPLEAFERITIRSKPGQIVEPEWVGSISLSKESVPANCRVPGCSVITIDTHAVAAEPEKIRYLYTVSGGFIMGEGPTVEWNLSGVKPGTYTITAAVDTMTVFGAIGKAVTKTITVTEGER